MQELAIGTAVFETVIDALNAAISEARRQGWQHIVEIVLSPDDAKQYERELMGTAFEPVAEPTVPLESYRPEPMQLGVFRSFPVTLGTETALRGE